jgi:PAS domain S-box-containing protein
LPQPEPQILPRVLFGNPNAPVRYASAVACTAVAAIITYALSPRLGSTVSPVFLVGVLFASWYGGLKPGLLSAFLSAVVCNFIFILPSGNLSWGADDFLRLITFMIAAVFVSSITLARHQAEETAREAEKQLAVTVKSIGDAVITTDASGRVTSMNAIAQSLTGWRQFEASGRHVESIIRIVDAEARCEVDTVVTRVLRDNVVLGVGGPVMMVTRDGSEVPVEQIATPIRDNQGQIKNIVLVLRNVPDPQPKDPAGLLAETITLLGSVGANMFAVNLDGRCAFVSKSAAELLGYRSYELADREICELIHWQNPGDTNLEEESSSGMTPEYGTATMWHRDGTVVPVQFSCVPLLVGERNIGKVVTVTDMTERQRAQEAITKLESIANAVDQAIISHTSDGIITSWNRAAERIYGYFQDEVVGRHVSIIHPPGYKQELQTLFDRIIRSERVEPFETVRIKKGGDQVFVSINILPISDTPDGSVCLAQIVSDLTERKRTEEEALRVSREQAAAYNRRRGNGKSSAVENYPTEAPRAMPQVTTRAMLPTNHRKATVLVGNSPVMQKLFAAIERVAPSDSSVLITGATGTGKELVARKIHEKSRRADGPFVDLNCSAIPETLIEAELFGHQRGTFTGASENRVGLFEVASGGTLFLDEVDALPLAAQAKLLRVLQEKCIRRVGGRTNIPVDVRIISASNCDLNHAVKEGRFRADLFYRLRVFPVQTPGLCQRDGDLELLISHFLERHANQTGASPRRFTAEAMAVLTRYDWPGNVRELESAVGYALAIGNREALSIEDLPPEFSHQPKQQQVTDLKGTLEGYQADGAPLAEIEKRYILSVLERFDGNQVRAAAALGIDRSKLYRRLKQYGIKAVKFLQEDSDGMQLLSSRKETAADTVDEDTQELSRAASLI